MKTAIGYIRVSGRRQELSPEVQETMIKNYCQLHGIELVKIIFEKAISGDMPIMERPGGKTISDFINAGVKNIIAVKLDRLFRSTVDALSQIQEWQDAKIAVHIIDLQGMSIDTSTANGKFFLTMLAALAEMELSRIRHRTQEVIDDKRSKGEFLGKVPFGFEHYDFMITSEGKQLGGKVRELPWRRMAIKDIKDMSSAGLSSRYIAKEISQQYAECSHSTICNLVKEPDEQIDFIKENA